jgi:hypothetical protein
VSAAADAIIVSCAQAWHYYRTYPNDPRTLKMMVSWPLRCEPQDADAVHKVAVAMLADIAHQLLCSYTSAWVAIYVLQHLTRAAQCTLH